MNQKIHVLQIDELALEAFDQLVDAE